MQGTIPLIRLLEDPYLYATSDPPADYLSSHVIRPLLAANLYGPGFIPNRHAWSDFNKDHFKQHLGSRLLQFPCPWSYPRPSRAFSSASADSMKQTLRHAVFDLINLSLNVIFHPPLVYLLYYTVYTNDARKLFTVYQTIPPTHVMWDDLYESLPDEFTVPGWNTLSIEQKGNALARMLPRIAHNIAVEMEETCQKWTQPVPLVLLKYLNQFRDRESKSEVIPVNPAFGFLRYLAYVRRRSDALYRITDQAIEEHDTKLITYLILTAVPLTEIIPYIALYVNADDIVRTTNQLRAALETGVLRSTLSDLEPRWEQFCQTAKTDEDALLRIFLQLPPAFPELLPGESELRSADWDKVLVLWGPGAYCVPGFQPDGACISTQSTKLEPRKRVNRVPGEIATTWDFSLLKNPDDPHALRALSKAYMYSNQHNTRYGYLLTNDSLAIFRRCEKEDENGIPRNGHIEVSKIFWLGADAYLPFFYLHLLATHPNKWKLQSSLWDGSKKLFDIHDESSFCDS